MITYKPEGPAKKITGLIVLVAIALAIWGLYSSNVKKIRESPQGDPVRTVEALMDAVVKASGLLWDEQKRDAMEKDMQELKASAQSGDEDVPPDIFEKYAIESPARLFKDERFGKAAAGSLCIFHIESFSIKETKTGEHSATVTVEFLPKDVFGLKKAISKLGAPTPEQPAKPVVVPFYLEKSRRRWYIVDITGELEPVIKAAHKLR